MAETTATRIRKPRARQRDVVVGALNERLHIIDDCRNLDDVKAHTARLRELFDELSRAMGKEGAEE